MKFFYMKDYIPGRQSIHPWLVLDEGFRKVPRGQGRNTS